MLVRRVLLALLALVVVWALQERRELQAVRGQLERLAQQEILEQQALQAQLETWVQQGVLERRVPPELLEQRVARVRLALREQLALPEMPEPLAASGPREAQGQAEP